jgi:hypothetical protein
MRPVPAAVSSLAARRVGDAVQMRFTIPTDNTDPSLPLELTRVDIYAAAGPPAATAPVPMAIPAVPLAIPAAAGALTPVNSEPLPLTRFQPVQLFQPAGAVKPVRPQDAPPTTVPQITKTKYLRKRIDVKRLPLPDAPPPPDDPNDHRPKPGDTITIDDQVTAERAAAAAATDVSVLRYVIIGRAGNRPGTPSPVLEVPLVANVPPPQNPEATYDETSVKLSWGVGDPTETFRVYRSVDGKEDGPPLNAAPLTTPAFTAPVEFGVERCFLIRAAVVRGPVSIESNPSAPACVKAIDTFPTAAPTGLSLLPTEDSNQLTWTAVSAPDLAGYLVLRAEEGVPARALTAEVITDTNYTDRTVKSGAHYTYTVVAVDKAGNRSAPSNPAEDIR